MPRQALSQVAKLFTTAFIFASLMSSTQPPASAQGTTVKRDLTGLIQRAISFLEKKNYDEFIRTCLRPSEVAELLEKYGTIEKVGAAYADSKRPATMLKVLYEALKVEPAVNEDETRASYRFQPPIDGDRALTLQKVDGRWYLRN
jgi:hypothetical protein